MSFLIFRRVELLNIDPLHSWFVLPFENAQLKNTFRTCKPRPQEAWKHFPWRDEHIKSSGPGGAFYGPALKSTMTNCMESLMTLKTLCWKMALGAKCDLSHISSTSMLSIQLWMQRFLTCKKLKRSLMNSVRNFSTCKQNLTCLKPWAPYPVWSFRGVLYWFFEERHGYKNINKKTQNPIIKARKSPWCSSTASILATYSFV